MPMKKIINWFKESNRWKHLVYGFLIGLPIPNILLGVYIILVVSTIVEFKDKQWGGKFDWIDWGLTMAGGILGSGISSIIKFIC